MIGPILWAASCIVVASVAIVLVCGRAPGRRRPLAAADAPPQPEPEPQPQPDDFPTTPIPRVPAPPTPRRTVLRADELLWHKAATDDEGVITLGLLPAPAGQLGVLMDVDGDAVGVRLDRDEVQGIRDALTRHLVASAKPVRS